MAVEVVSDAFINNADARTLTQLRTEYGNKKAQLERVPRTPVYHAPVSLALSPHYADIQKLTAVIKKIDARLAAITRDQQAALAQRNQQRVDQEAAYRVAPKQEGINNASQHAAYQTQGPSYFYSEFKNAVNSNNDGRALYLIPAMSGPNVKPTILNLFTKDANYWWPLITPYLTEGNNE
jgi:hypothetical protein